MMAGRNTVSVDPLIEEEIAAWRSDIMDAAAAGAPVCRGSATAPTTRSSGDKGKCLSCGRFVAMGDFDLLDVHYVKVKR